MCLVVFPAAIVDSIERRNACPRLILGSTLQFANRLRIDFHVDSAATSQCETNSERAPAYKERPREASQRLSASLFPSGGV
jgi:hypothetical protein